jgi:Rrf2 family protein
MLKLSRKMLYAIESVVDIAYHSGGQPVQSKEITRRQGIPSRYLEQTLQQLVRDQILIGMRGPRGGYRLARERRRISLGDIVRSVAAIETAEDPIEAPTASEVATKVVRPLWARQQEALMAELDAISIEDMCVNAHKAGIHSEARERLDYTI